MPQPGFVPAADWGSTNRQVGELQRWAFERPGRGSGCLLRRAVDAAAATRRMQSRASWTLWNAYAARFIDAQGRVFDPKGDQHTTSEGRGLRAVLFAGRQRSRHFDRVLNWTQANLAGGRSGNPPAGVAVGQGQGRRVEDARSQLGLRCRCLDGLHAARGRPALEQSRSTRTWAGRCWR